MRALISRLFSYSQPRTPAHNNVSPTIPTERSKSPPRVATTPEARTAKSLNVAWKPSVFCIGLRTIHDHHSVARIRHFSSAQALAATLTILAGIHDFPLAATSAALKELLSRRRHRHHQNRGRPDLIEDVPSPPTRVPGPIGVNETQEERYDSEGPDWRLPGSESAHIESPRRSEENNGRTRASRSTGDSTGGSVLAPHSLDAIDSPGHTPGSPGISPDEGISRRDFAYESSSSVEALPTHSPPPQARPPSDPSSSVQSFVTAPASSPQPSNRSIHRGAYGQITRSESPKPILGRRKSSFNIRGPSGLRVSVAADPDHELRNETGLTSSEKPGQSLDIPEEAPDPTPTETNRPTRRILIIGSDYQSGTRQTGTMFSIKTLLGFDNDIDLLREAFTKRGYQVELHDKKDYRREDVLQRVAAFLSEAQSGDIRAVAFTGHAYSAPDGTIMLVPPYCPTIDTAIPCAEWEDNMWKHSQPGSIIFSIMAHCFSGDFMRQGHDYETWMTPEIGLESPSQTATKATFITFASSTKKQQSFESTVERRAEAGAYDHFLYALAMAIRSDEVRTWESFFATFKNIFDRARLHASWAHHHDCDAESIAREATRIESECQRAYSWRKENLQEPRFSASEILGYSRMFLLPAPAEQC